MPTPKITNDALYQLLRDNKVNEFNLKRQNGTTPNMVGCDFRGLDLRNANLNDLDLTDAYFRGADLRGIDLRNTILAGASLANAKISGCYFPDTLDPMEIKLSLEFGTRLRLKKN